MTTARSSYDVIVIGAGIEGSSSAYNLVKQGYKVLLLEQFPLPHSRGSSHGQTRITRYAYGDEFYVRMMVDAFPMWAQLEKESGKEFFVNCGILDLHIQDTQRCRNVQTAMRAHNVPYELLSGAELARRFPMIRGGDRACGVWDPNGGVLMADKALQAFHSVFRQKGGVLHDGEPVTSVIPGANVTVVTSRAVYSSPNVVIAAGPWTGRMTSQLGLEIPLRPIRINVMYWKAREGVDHSTQKMPCFLDSRGGDLDFHTYGLPDNEYPGLVKLCLHEGPPIDPDERDKVTGDGWVEHSVRETLESTFPFLETTPSIREYCIYTMTPDQHPYIDRHPKHNNIVVCAGFSGHGFKLAPAVGKAVSELVLKKQPSYNMKPFRLDRFSPKSSL